MHLCGGLALRSLGCTSRLRLSAAPLGRLSATSRRHEEVVCLLRVEHAVGGAEGAAVDDDVLAPQVHVLPPPVAARLQPAAEAARQLVHVQPRRARRPLAVLRADGRRQRRRRRGALGRRPERAVDAVEAYSRSG